MNPAGGRGFWSAGGDVLTTGGRVLPPGRCPALEAFYAGLLAHGADPAARAYLERRAPATDWPAASTIGELFDREGLTVKRKLRRRSPPSKNARPTQVGFSRLASA